MFGWIPKITRADIEPVERAGGTLTIYADCTASMRHCSSFPNMIAAIDALWPINGARLFGYSDGAQNIYEVSSPRQLVETDNGTEFSTMFQHASELNADMTLIFSDGIPSDPDQMWRVWHATTFPIATHLALSWRWVQERPATVALMRDLCRGGGDYTFGDEIEDMKRGVIKLLIPFRQAHTIYRSQSCELCAL